MSGAGPRLEAKGLARPVERSVRSVTAFAPLTRGARWSKNAHAVRARP